jgi:CheY-like chemotaxis protein
MNLVVNAAEAIGDAGGSIRLATRLVHADRALFETMYLAPQLPEGDYIVVQVSDTGCGMSPETAAKVFDPFFSTKFTGRGLGLAAVLGIVRGHHGAIKVESTPGKGSTFTLLFPAFAKAPAAQSSAAVPGHTITVLVVDDEDCVRRTVQAMLQRNGIQVLLAEDGQAGLEQYAARHGVIDAVLLDLTMPLMDGIEALGRMLAIDPAARILLMSGFDENLETARYGDLGQRASCRSRSPSSPCSTRSTARWADLRPAPLVLHAGGDGSGGHHCHRDLRTHRTPSAGRCPTVPARVCA